MERIVNFFNRTVDIGSWLISCIAIYVVMLPAVLMPLIMGQQLLFFNKKSFKVPKSDAFLLDLVAKMPRSAKLKGLNLRYPIAWRDFLLKNTMSTGKLRNMMFKISHFWDEKCPTKKSEDRIPTMLLPASPQPAIPRPALKDFWNNRRQESVPFVLKVHPSSPSRLSVHGRSDELLKQSAWEAMPFVSKVHPSGPSRTAVHGPPPRPALTDFWNNRRGKLCHSFQKSIPAARHGRPSTARPPRPALTDFWNNRREELVPFVSKVHPSGPSRTAVHGPAPRPALTDFWNNRRGKLCHSFQKSIPAARHGRPSTASPPRPALIDFWNNRREELVPFVSKVHPSGPSRTAVHGPPPHGPLWQTSETIGVRNSCRLFQKSIPAARHGRPSTARPPRPALTDFWNNRREELVPFVSKVHPSGPSRTAVHGPPPRPALTDFWNNRRGKLCHSFQKSIPAARHGRPSTARPPRPALTDFWNNRREELVSFVSKVHPSGPSRTAVHGPPPTARSDGLLKQSAWGTRAVCFKSPSQRPVTDGRPRPAPTVRSDGLLQHSAPGIRAICFKSPSQQPVTASLPRSALTASYDRLLKHLASEIHLINFFSKAHRSGPSRPSVHDPLPQPALTHTVKAIFIENCCFSKSIKPKIICNPDLIFGLAEHLVTMTLKTTTHFECATLTLHSNSGLSFYLALESTEVEWNIIEWSAKHTAPRKTWSNIIFFKAWIILIIKKIVHVKQCGNCITYDYAYFINYDLIWVTSQTQKSLTVNENRIWMNI